MRKLRIAGSENPLLKNKRFIELFEASKQFLLKAGEETALIESLKSGSIYEKVHATFRLQFAPLHIILKVILQYTSDEALLKPLLAAGLRAVRKTIAAEVDNTSNKEIYGRFMTWRIRQAILECLEENEMAKLLSNL
jgi:hypothetical protein